MDGINRFIYFTRSDNNEKDIDFYADLLYDGFYDNRMRRQ